MRTDDTRAGAVTSAPALLRALLLSASLHTLVFAYLATQQQDRMTSGALHSQSRIHATIINISATNTPSAIGESSTRAASPPSSSVETGASAAPVSQEEKTRQAESLTVTPTSPPEMPILITAPQPRYYTQRELDVPPYVLESPPGDPPELLGRPESGRVALELWIDDSGQVTKAGVLASDLPDEFGQGALSTFTATRFSPGKIDGETVHSYIRMEVVFGPEPIRDARTKRHLPAQRLTPP